MPKSKRSNRDHAHQHQYPGPDNEVIAADLQALLTPGLYAQQAYFRQLGIRERLLEFAVNVGGGADVVVAAGTECAGIDSHVSAGRPVVVQSSSSVPTGGQSAVSQLPILVV